MTNERLTNAIPERTCGECSACCRLLAFESEPGDAPFFKAAYQPCCHLVQIGCGIHSERPACCRTFQCGWLVSPDLGDEMRPDRSGVVFTLNAGPPGSEPKERAVHAFEARSGAADESPVSDFLQRASQEMLVIIVRGTAPIEFRSAQGTVFLPFGYMPNDDDAEGENSEPDIPPTLN